MEDRLFYLSSFLFRLLPIYIYRTPFVIGLRKGSQLYMYNSSIKSCYSCIQWLT